MRFIVVVCLIIRGVGVKYIEFFVNLGIFFFMVLFFCIGKIEVFLLVVNFVNNVL